jgi:hypothetical protein
MASARRAEQMAAIETLDAAVVASGGEVITLADRQAAITELDKAVESKERIEYRLWQAILQAQRVEAWLGDAEFALPDDAHSAFTAWVKQRYGYEKSRAQQLASAARVYELLPPTAVGEVIDVASHDITERQLRPLTPLLSKAIAPEDLIPEVWASAVEAAEAEHKPESVASHITRIISSHRADPSWFPTPTVDDLDKKLDADLRKFRDLFRSLYRRMNHNDFADRVIGWINEEVGE